MEGEEMPADARLVQIDRRPHTRETEPLPVPSGWFCVGWSDELQPGGVLTRWLAGHELVLFRTRAGQAAALDAHCPHMGAHLGHGGTVEDGTIRCPFHGFCFDTGGVCVKTGYGTKPPPKARMRAWPLLERHGVLLVFFDPLGGAPTWEVPEVDMAGWTRLRHHDFELRSHPQEIAENSVDLGHFQHIHGYEDIAEEATLETEGAYLHARYRFRRRRRGVGGFRDISVSVEIHQHGLGYAFVEAQTSIGMLGRQLVMCRPTQGDRVVLHIGNSIRASSDGHWLLSLVPRPLLAALAFAEFRRDVQQDLIIWNNKRHITPPALALGDGPVGAYRKWARQFYAEAT
jgi:phenylpropionate dioxygenase-like ring-hydroxylating dioxygenase large terminal subunit